MCEVGGSFALLSPCEDEAISYQSQNISVVPSVISSFVNDTNRVFDRVSRDELARRSPEMATPSTSNGSLKSTKSHSIRNLSPVASKPSFTSQEHLNSPVKITEFLKKNSDKKQLRLKLPEEKENENNEENYTDKGFQKFRSELIKTRQLIDQLDLEKKKKKRDHGAQLHACGTNTTFRQQIHPEDSNYPLIDVSRIQTTSATSRIQMPRTTTATSTSCQTQQPRTLSTNGCSAMQCGSFGSAPILMNHSVQVAPEKVDKRLSAINFSSLSFLRPLPEMARNQDRETPLKLQSTLVPSDTPVLKAPQNFKESEFRVEDYARLHRLMDYRNPSLTAEDLPDFRATGTYEEIKTATERGAFKKPMPIQGRRSNSMSRLQIDAVPKKLWPRNGAGSVCSASTLISTKGGKVAGQERRAERFPPDTRDVDNLKLPERNIRERIRNFGGRNMAEMIHGKRSVRIATPNQTERGEKGSESAMRKLQSATSGARQRPVWK
ncbi:hypothetical protein WR25_04220 [Diploscapter pachys]|uniref:Uncharacterized protein n=1 Tax=Diploscapter pachys TaxID=2018661 RepID=A0A2A2K189_9BILA|nr:hypothetical protein WR25_04220 [Diploscapter pachys]